MRFKHWFLLLSILLSSLTALSKEKIFKSAISRAINSGYKDKSVKGIHAEILQIISTQINRPIQIESVPVPRQAAMFSEKKVDLIMTTENELMAKLVARKIPVYDVPYFIVSLAKKPFISLENKGRIGRMRGGCTQNVLSQKHIVIEELKTYQLGVAMLEKGRLDGVCGTEILLKALNDVKWPKEKTHILPVSSKFLYLYVQPDTSEEDVKLLQSAVQKISKNGTIEKIFRKYQDLHSQ